MDKDDHTQAPQYKAHHMEVGRRSENIAQQTLKLRQDIQSTHRPTRHWTFVMGTLPRTHFQTRGTCDGTIAGTLVVIAALTAGLLAFTVASLIFGMTRESTKMLAI
jgi:hypothetical protein